MTDIETRRAQKRNWYYAHKEQQLPKMREYRKAYYEKNKELEKTKMKERYWAKKAVGDAVSEQAPATAE